jgi:hypothetical protein
VRLRRSIGDQRARAEEWQDGGTQDGNRRRPARVGSVGRDAA